jgi:uncharacterized protein (DUF58 family)
VSRINYARLNHILIPSTKAGRDRLRESAIGRALGPVVAILTAFSREGQLFAGAMLFGGVFGFEVRTTCAHVLVSALAALLLASLVATPLYRMRGVRLEVTPPPRAGVGEEITFTIALHNEGARDFHAVRVSGPFLPWDGAFTRRAPELRALAAGGTAKVEMRARFVARGEHHLDAFHAAALVPLGLTLGPSVASGGCRFLVVPKIADVASLATPMGRRHQPGGVALASSTGESKDLLGVRPYRPGDPVRDLHARTWARIGAPVVREYQQEYFSRIGVVVDTDVRAASEDAFEAGISLAAGVVRHLSRGEALIDLLVASGGFGARGNGPRVHRLTLGRSLGTFDHALDLLATVEAGGAFEAETLLAELDPHLPRLSCLVFVALAWNEERARVAERVRAAGVGCKVVVIGDRVKAATGDAPAAIAVQSIERGERLAL